MDRDVTRKFIEETLSKSPFWPRMTKKQRKEVTDRRLEIALNPGLEVDYIKRISAHIAENTI